MNDNQEAAIPLPFWSRMFVFLGLSLATFMVVLDYSIANVSLPYIAGDLAISADQGAYVITSFAVGNAIGLAMTGWLAKSLGQIRIFLLSTILFIIFSWVCGISSNILVLVNARFIQGLVSGPMIPMSQSLIVMTSSSKNRSTSIAIWATIVIVAPIVGPIAGGYISDWYHWPWIFYINIPIGLLAIFLIALFLKGKDKKPEKVRTDLIGLFLLTVGVSSLQILLDKGQQWDWLRSPIICTLGSIAIVSFTLLIIWELLHPLPFLNLRLFRFKTFTTAVVAIAFSYAIYFGSVVLIPLWLQVNVGYTGTWAGLAVAPLGLAPLFLAPFNPIIIARIGIIRTLIISFALFCAACFYNAYFTPQVDFYHIGLSRFFFGIGIAFYITPLMLLVVSEIPHEQLANATGIFHFVRAMVGGIGTSVFVTLWQRRTIFHHERIGSNVTQFSQPTADTLATLAQHNLSPKASLAALNIELDNQSALLAINDSFYLMAWVFIGLIVFLILGFIKGKKSLPEQTK